jgi:AcrR family transcriptional regulator
MIEDSKSDTTDRRTQILDAALQVFSTKGYHKATNKDIAEAAGGISPGLIYWYFKDKEDLLLSLLRDRVPLLQLIDHPERLMSLPFREGLRVVADAYLTQFSRPAFVALVRLMIGEAARFPQLADTIYRTVIGRLYSTIVSYIQHQINQGYLRPHDATISARAFLGSLLITILARVLFRQPEALNTPDSAIINLLVDLFDRGLAAHPPPSINGHD